MTKRIRLTPATAKEFVNVAAKCDFDVDISYNRYVVDAKSILGVLGLDFSKVLTVCYNGYNENLEQYLRSISCAS